MNLPAARLASVEIEIEDGDDAPLAFRSVRARTPVPEVYLAAPAGEYALLLGAPGESAPRYELARVRDVVLALAWAPVSAGDLAANPRYSLPARLGSGEWPERVALWIALGAAVLVLIALTLRLAKREGRAAS